MIDSLMLKGSLPGMAEKSSLPKFKMWREIGKSDVMYQVVVLLFNVFRG